MKYHLLTLAFGLLIGWGIAMKVIEPKTIIKTEIKTVVETKTNTVVEEKFKDGKVIERVTKVVEHKLDKQEVKTKQNDWFLQVSKTGVYSAQINRRIVGDIYVGISAATNGQLGVSVGFTF